jgi:hypothetical protein
MNHGNRTIQLRQGLGPTLVIMFCAVAVMQSTIILSAFLKSEGLLSANAGHKMIVAAFVGVSIISIATLYIRTFKRIGAGSGD